MVAERRRLLQDADVVSRPPEGVICPVLWRCRIIAALLSDTGGYACLVATKDTHAVWLSDRKAP